MTDSIEGTVLKWPNDVHIDGNKLCGILAEAGPVGQAFKAAPKTELTKVEVGKAEVNKAEVNKAEVNKAEVNKAVGSAAPSARVVVGMGINVTLTREDLPIEKATSLELEGRDTDRTELAITVLKNLRRRIAQWENQDPQLLRDYRAVCSSLGQEVRLETRLAMSPVTSMKSARTAASWSPASTTPQAMSRTCVRSSKPLQ